MEAPSTIEIANVYSYGDYSADPPAAEAPSTIEAARAGADAGALTNPTCRPAKRHK